MMNLIKSNRKINLSYVIGRFSPEIGSNFQYFPIDNWEQDLKTAKKFNFDGTEWIVSDFSNPIFNQTFRKIIKSSLKKDKLKICSLSLDMIMDYPLHKMKDSDVDWIIKKLLIIIKYFSINRVTIPIEERSRFNNYKEKESAIKCLRKFYTAIHTISNLCIETDISPNALNEIFNLKYFKKLGVLLDLGNTKAHGFAIDDYIKMFPKKIYGVHIKQRSSLFGKTRRLEKNFKELKILLKNLDKLSNCKDITFQTFKSNKNYQKDMKYSLKNFKICIKENLH